MDNKRASEEVESASKRQEDNNKKVSKPGRKPIDTEPKNKRTAQNRAAQRAFRERKEKKMKELEERINQLESEKKNANIESEFLRSQVHTLINELAKHRGINDLSELNLPQLPSGSTNSSEIPSTFNVKSGSISSTYSTPQSSASNNLSSDVSVTSHSSTNLEDEANTKPHYAFQFPWSRKNSSTKSQDSQAKSTAPPLASDESASSSSESSPFELYNTEELSNLPLFNKAKELQARDDFKFDEHFDEGISEFCNELGAACGTKDCPIPKPKTRSADQDSTKKENSVISTLGFGDDPLSFLDEENLQAFDPSMAFPNENLNLFNDIPEEHDPLGQLTTEESLYDPFGIFNNHARSPIVESTPAEKPQTKIDSNKVPVYVPKETCAPQDSNEYDVVPSNDNRFLKCTEIWDRITAHPKYSEIDIDGLCSELRTKAKCSDKGVVIDSADVNSVLFNTLGK